MYNNVYESPLSRPTSYYAPQMPCYPVPWPPNPDYNQPMPSGHGYYQAPINPTHPNLYPEMVYNEPCGYNPEIYPEMANMTKPRIRPNSVGRKPQRRSVAALQDLQRYFQPPLQRTLPTTPEFSASYFNHPLGTMPRNKRPKHQISAEISATLPNNSRRKSVILPPDESKHNIFHWFKEKMGKNEERAPKKVYTSGSLPRNFALRTNSPKTKSVPRMKKADARPGVANGFNNVFYTQIDPKMRPAQLSPERGRKPLNASPERQRRAINLSPERSSRKLGTAKVDHRRLNSQNLSPERSRRNFQTLSPELSRARNSSAERSRTLPGPENSFYDNHNPMLYGYYNGNDVNSNNGTLSKKRITRYTTDGKPIQMQRNGALDNSTYASGDVPAKPPQSAEILRNSIIDPLNVKQYPKRSSNGQIVPPEPPPDYSDRSDSPASQRRSPSPFSVPPRVRFRFPSADDIHSVKKEEKIVEKVENVPQPKGLWARTFDLKIYKKLRPLIQIRGVKIDEKELAKNEKKRPNPPKNPPATGTAVTTKTSAVPSSQNKPLPTEPANETAKKRSIERFTAAVKETLKNTQTDQPKLADTLHKPASILCSQGSKKRRAPDPPMVPEASYSEPLKPAELDLRTDVLDAEMALKMAENAYMNHYEPNGIAEVGKANLAAENSVNLHNSAGNQKPWESIGNGQNNNKNEHNGTYNSLNTGNHAQPSNFPTENSDYLKFESDIESGRKIENSQESGRTSSLPTSPMVLHDISSLRAKFEADCSNITRIEANSSKMEDYSNPSKNDDQTVIKLKPVIDEGYQEDLTRLPRPLESKVWRYNPSTQGLVQYNEIEPKQPVISLHLDENGNTTTALLTDQYTQNSTQFNGYNDPNSTVTSSFRSTNSNSIPTAQSSANPLIADRGVCYVGGTRIEYFLDRSTGPLVVHYQTKRTVHMGNLVCGGGELPAGNEQEIDVYGSWTNNLPAQGVITDLDYGPGIVQKLRERFARLASTPRTEKDEFSDCTVQKRRFASAEPPSINTQILPKMDPSKLSDGMNSASSTGYSSEESNPSDASEPPKELSKSAPLPNERSRRSQSASHADDDLQKPEIHDPTHVITPIRSLREKFERQSQNSCMNKSVRTVYSPRSSSCHTSVVARYPPRQQSGSRKNSETSTVLTDSGVSSTTSTKNSLPSAKITPKQPLRRLSKPAVPSFATEFSMNSKENEDTKNLAESTGRKPTLPKRTVLAKLEPEQKIVVSPPSPHSSNASTSSGDCPSTKSNEQETSDDLDSIVSQDEFTIPPSHNATYFRAGVSPRPNSSNPEPHPVFAESDAEQPRHSLPMTSSKPSIQSQPVFKDSEPKSLANSAERPNHSSAVQSTSQFAHSDGKQLAEERPSPKSDRNPVQSPLPPQERPTTLSLPKSNGSIRSNGSPGTTPIAKAAQCKQDALKDASGMMEVHRMLQKFNAKRFNESKDKVEPGSEYEADNSTGSAKTLRPADSDTSFHTANTSPGSQNSIQKSSGSSYASTSSSPKQGTPRKSLTAKYLEAKASEKKDTSLEIISESDASPQPVNVNTILPDLRELPDTSYFNHTLSFYNKDDAGSTTSEDSLEIINDPQEEKLLAPIRQSLLHLVAEEDVPEILEAMAENLTFHIIQDTRMAATTSSCIQKQQRSKSESRRICFTEEPPQVFAYPDENFAMELGEWKEGRPITYNEYQNIVQTANEETQHQMNQLARWRHQMQLKYSEQERALEDAVHQMNQAAINSVASTPSRTPTPTSAI